MQNRRTLKVLFLAYSSLLLLGICDNMRGPLFPEILKTFSVSDAKGSLFFSLSSAFGFLGGFFSDALIHRLGATKALRLSILLLVLGQLILAFSNQFGVLLFGVFFFGFSLGLMGVIQNMLVVQEIPNSPLKNKILSGLHSMYAASSLLAPMVVNLVAWAALPFEIWRLCFILGVVFCLTILGLSFYGPSIDEPLRPPQERNPRDPHRGPQLYFAVILSCYVLAEILISTRMALYLRRQFDSSLSESSWYTAGFFLSLLASRLLFTAWAPSLRLKTQLNLSLGLTLLSLLVGIFYHPAGLALSGLFMGPFYPLMMAKLGQIFHHNIRQAIAWAVALCSLFIVFMHVSVGVITDHWGLQVAFLLGPFFCLVAIIMIGAYEKVFRRLQHSF